MTSSEAASRGSTSLDVPRRTCFKDVKDVETEGHATYTSAVLSSNECESKLAVVHRQTVP